MKGFLLLIVLAIAGNYLAERFVIKDPNDPNDTGLVEQAPGMGLDDFARGATIAATVILGRKLLSGVLGKKGG